MYVNLFCKHSSLCCTEVTLRGGRKLRWWWVWWAWVQLINIFLWTDEHLANHGLEFPASVKQSKVLVHFDEGSPKIDKLHDENNWRRRAMWYSTARGNLQSASCPLQHPCRLRTNHSSRQSVSLWTQTFGQAHGWVLCNRQNVQGQLIFQEKFHTSAPARVILTISQNHLMH